MIRELTNFYFKDGENWCIVMKKYGATWTDKKNKFKITFDKSSLKLAINFFLGNCFCQFR